MAASSSTAVSASTVGYSNNYRWHDIFINHRGVDVKKTFARSLYLRLLSNGLTAFLDQEELQRGYNFPSQIKHAIGTASVHVAIFSPRYGESCWCLDELVMMLESKAPIVPMFYRVTPAEVRWTQSKDGNYAQALQNLAEKRTREGTMRYDSNTIEKWRNALSLVADNSGFELEVCNSEELELELLDKVVKHLSVMVKKPDLHVAKYPTGLDEKLKHFEDKVLFQQQQSREPHILGIWGLGGIGKTTLAKHFFNEKKLDYHRSCFLPDVRDHAAKSSLNSLQRKLLKSLTGFDQPVDSVDEGKWMLIEPLKSSNALVILDDVDDLNQVDALLPVQNHDLCTGSLILITSRDQHVLRSSRVATSSIYSLTGLNEQHSRELFCSHAFSQPYPIPIFESLVYKFLDSCNGLPLSLKLFGALLYGRDISDWEDELGSLQQILPTEIQKTFMISYDALNREEKQIFLDIACFFIGENRDRAIRIWDGSGWKGRRGFQNLQNKCLVEVDSSNVIHMHDHLRDLGRDVAEPSSPRRLWRWTENSIDDLLQQSSVIAVRGIKLVLGQHNGDVVFSAIGMMRLQLLDTENAIHTENYLLDRILRRLEFSNLIWLCWKNCPYSSLPSWIPMKSLRVLQVSGSTLETLWPEESQAEGCEQLKSIWGLEQLTKLRLLNVNRCSELEELPSMETFVSLEELQVCKCVKVKNIRGLAQCTKLQRLNVSHWLELEELPSMETLVSLEEFDVFDCVKLKSIKGLEQLTKLPHLNVRGCSELEALPRMETLVSLEEFDASDCVKLKSIWGLEQCTKLQRLNVSYWSGLEELPSMETLVCLEEFEASIV